MSLHKPNVPEAGRASRLVRAHSRQNLPKWLTASLDNYQGALEVTEVGVPADYFQNFSDSVHDRVRRREAEFTHRQLPRALAMRLSMPLPAEIPSGATAYFRTLLEKVKNQVETIEASGVPAWVHDALALMEREVSPVQQASYMQELVDTLGRAISEFETIPEWLQEALAFRSDAMPIDKQVYFTSFADRVRVRLAAVELDEPVSGWMHEALNATPDTSEATPTYFTRFSERLRQHIEDDAATGVPVWLDQALMTAAHPRIPGGSETYFKSFSSQVLQTVSEVSHLETEELVDPTTVERLVDAPDRFQELLASYNDLSLPVGQELYFEDFADRVKARIHARKLDHLPQSPIVRLMSRQPVQWATAACFGLLLGFVWFWKPDATPAVVPPTKAPIHAPIPSTLGVPKETSSGSVKQSNTAEKPTNTPLKIEPVMGKQPDAPKPDVPVPNSNQ